MAKVMQEISEKKRIRETLQICMFVSLHMTISLVDVGIACRRISHPQKGLPFARYLTSGERS
jgi:hypothetical protein